MAQPNADTIALTVNIKDRNEPVCVHVLPSITPAQILEDLQRAEYVRELRDRNVAFTHNGQNLLPTRSITDQGVKCDDTLTITWDGRLAGAGR